MRVRRLEQPEHVRPVGTLKVIIRRLMEAGARRETHFAMEVKAIEELPLRDGRVALQELSSVTFEGRCTIRIVATATPVGTCVRVILEDEISTRHRPESVGERTREQGGCDAKNC